MNKKRILVVEDESESRYFLKRVLERAGYDVKEAASGKEASQMYHQESYDLVITDIIMPEMDGMEVILELHRDAPQTKILAVSGGGHYYSGDEYLQLASLLDTDGTLTKPFLPEDVLREIRRILA